MYDVSFGSRVKDGGYSVVLVKIYSTKQMRFMEELCECVGVFYFVNMGRD